MRISKAYLEARAFDKNEKTMLYVMALILPPVPLFVMTGPNYTIRTVEFWMATWFQLGAVGSIVITRRLNVFYVLFQLAALIYSFRFVHSGFERGRSLSTGYIDETPEEAV